MQAKKPSTKDTQAQAFITALHGQDWRSLNSWTDSGHVFELLSRGTARVIVQIYPQGHGFEVWRPVTDSNTIAETAVAVQVYAEGGRHA